MLKFHRDIHDAFLMCSSSERDVNYATKMERMLLSSTCEEQQSVGLVRFLCAKKIHRDMRGMYGDDCTDRRKVSFKKLPPWKMRTTWRYWYGKICLSIHAAHVPVNFTRVEGKPQKNPSTRKLTRPGIEPSPAEWEVTMLSLEHSGTYIR